MPPYKLVMLDGKLKTPSSCAVAAVAPDDEPIDAARISCIGGLPIVFILLLRTTPNISYT
jgi:hypothetical protein